MKAMIRKFLQGIYSTVHKDIGGKVVYYHDVSHQTRYTKMDTPLELFLAHLLCARERKYEIVAHVPVADHQLMLCFDDGFRGIWDAREFFYEQKIRPTVFLVVERVGREGYLTWPEILELQKHGFDFESHTWSHPHLETVAAEDLPHELRDARHELSDRLGKDVTQLCLPCGLFTREVLRQVVAAGYTACFTTLPGSTRCPIKLKRGEEAEPCERNFQLVPRHLVQAASVREFGSILDGGAFLFYHHYLRQRQRP